MALKQRNFVLAVISSVVAAAAAASPTLAQAPALAGGADGAALQTGASIPDFTGAIWAHPMLGFESPLSGLGPVVNTKRTRTGTSDSNLLVGDYTNPILKPAAAEIVKKRGKISQSGVAFPDPDAMCMYEPVPYILWNFEIQILQRPDTVTILYNHDHEFRKVRMNQAHPAKVVPSAHGDSVGHYEGDTLVIDTVGVKVGPYTMIDRLGTPYGGASRRGALSAHRLRGCRGGTGARLQRMDPHTGLRCRSRLQGQGIAARIHSRGRRRLHYAVERHHHVSARIAEILG
jgi:hypothetical protein